MVKYSFLDLTKDVLGKSTEPLTVHEIWLKAEEIGLVSKVGTSGKTPEKTLAARLYVDIRDNEKTIFYQSSKRPARGRKEIILTCLESKVAMYEKFGFKDKGIAQSTWGGEEWHEMGVRI